MKLRHFLTSLPLILCAFSALLSAIEVYTFDVNGYLLARPETWLLMLFIALYVYLVTHRVLLYVRDRQKIVFGVLSGGGAHLIGSAGGAVLWLMVDRLAHRTAFGGIALAFSDFSGEFSSNLLGVLLLLVCSLIYLAWIPFLQLGAVVFTILFGLYVAGVLEVNRLPEQLADKAVFVSRRLRDVRIGLPEFTHQEEVTLNQHWTQEGFQIFSDMRSSAAPPRLIQAFYWCLHDRIDCRFVEHAAAVDSTEFPRSSLQVGTCEDLEDLSNLPPHKGVTSLSLGGKGQPCLVLSTWDTIDNLFPDLQDLELNEPTDNLLRELPDQITSLSVRMREASAGILEAIGAHGQIVTLKISTNFLPESALFYLSRMESLHRLWLKGKGLSNDCLRGGDLPSLRELTLGPGSSIALFDIRHLERLNLQRLEIFSDTMTKENVQTLVSQFPAPPKEVVVKQYESSLLDNSDLPKELKEILIRQMKNDSEW